MRVVMVGLLGGLLMLVWGVVAHMILPLGQVGMRQPLAEDVALHGLQAGLGSQPGVYQLPALAPSRYDDPAARQNFAQKSLHSPFAWVIYQPQGRDPTQMGPQVLRQWLSDSVAALLLAGLMRLVGGGLGRRWGVALLATLFAWCSVLLPYWNWYRLPTDFTVAALLEQLGGWLIAGLVMASLLGRGRRRSTHALKPL